MLRSLSKINWEMIVMQNQINELRKSLEWAWENMSFTEYLPDHNADFRYCNICHETELEHTSDCEAIKQKKIAMELLGK